MRWGWLAGLALLVAGCGFDVSGLQGGEPGSDGARADAMARDAGLDVAADGRRPDGPYGEADAADDAGLDGAGPDSAPVDAALADAPPPAEDAPPPPPPCGGEGEPCCAGDVCTADRTICSGGTCTHCGDFGEKCCSGHSCPGCGLCICGPLSGTCW